jgi:hypothetical protein
MPLTLQAIADEVIEQTVAFAAMRSVAIGTNRKSAHVRCEVGCQGISRLVMLTLSSSGCDPKRDSED